MRIRNHQFKILRSFFISSILLICMFIGQAQEKKLYDPLADASADIRRAVDKAGVENKFVLVQAGGNWCSWCLEFARFCKADPKIDSVINASFIWYHLNYSKENRNLDIFARYQFPQRFGFPVFLILNGKGELIHTENSVYLEGGNKSYDREKVISFLKMWSPAALNPQHYTK